MRIFLEAELLKWMLNLKIMPEALATKDFRMNANGKYELTDTETIEELEFGIAFSKILKILIDLNLGIFANAKDNLDLIKETKSQASKLYNWNIISAQLKNLLDLTIDKDTKDLILSGDIQATIDVLFDLYTRCRLRGLKMHLFKRDLAKDPVNLDKVSVRSNADDSRFSVRQLKSTKSDMRSSGRLPLLGKSSDQFMDNAQNPPKNEELDLETFDPYIEYSDTRSCLEFFVLAICRNIRINAIQVIQL